MKNNERGIAEPEIIAQQVVMKVGMAGTSSKQEKNDVGITDRI